MDTTHEVKDATKQASNENTPQCIGHELMRTALAPSTPASTAPPPKKDHSTPKKRSISELLDARSEMPAHTRALINFMRELHLEQYTPKMIMEGYDDLDFLSGQKKIDLQGVAFLVRMLPGHAAKFVESITRRIKISASARPPKVPKADSDGDSSYVVCIVDRSGSMADMGSAVKNGFNEFLEEQKAFAGECSATVVRFDNTVEVVHHGVDLKDIPAATDTTFTPRGMTALYDAIGDTLKMVAQKISTLASKPKKVMVLVLTDGAENASSRHTNKAIVKAISHCEKKLGWTFVFVGANQDAIATGTQMGFSAQSCLTYTANAEFQRKTWSSINSNFLRQRSGGDSSWTPVERRSSSMSMDLF